MTVQATALPQQPLHFQKDAATNMTARKLFSSCNIISLSIPFKMSRVNSSPNSATRRQHCRAMIMAALLKFEGTA